MPARGGLAQPAIDGKRKPQRGGDGQGVFEGKFEGKGGHGSRHSRESGSGDEQDGIEGQHQAGSTEDEVENRSDGWPQRSSNRVFRNTLGTLTPPTGKTHRSRAVCGSMV